MINGSKLGRFILKLLFIIFYNKKSNLIRLQVYNETEENMQDSVTCLDRKQ